MKITNYNKLKKTKHFIWNNKFPFQLGDVHLQADSDGTEYLELTERQTKTRNGMGTDVWRFSQSYGQLAPSMIQ